jgi:hypothetical protein
MPSLDGGNIGMDWLVKILPSTRLECGVFIGRNLASPGMAKTQAFGIPVSAECIHYIEKNPDCCDLVFDATSAKDHFYHASILEHALCARARLGTSEGPIHRVAISRRPIPLLAETGSQGDDGCHDSPKVSEILDLGQDSKERGMQWKD